MNKITTTFTVAIAVLITGCSYGSKYEAREACNEWQKGGTQYMKKIGDYPSRTSYNRYCDDEPETKKILGFENKAIKAGKTYQYDKLPGESKVTKRFQY